MRLLSLLRADAERQLYFAGERGPASPLRLARATASPRFAPVLLYRLSHWCASHRLRPVGKALSTANFVLFGLEIGLDCAIGPGLYLPHTQGTVLGARRIGANAVIYHGVTVGAKTPDLDYDPEKRPTIEDGVLLGAGAKVLGPVTVASGAVVAANAVVVRSVQERTTVAGIPAAPVDVTKVGREGAR
jgi:serine O-acetyltransferase